MKGKGELRTATKHEWQRCGMDYRLWDVVIVEIATGKVESIVGKSMYRTKGFYNAEKRAESAISRLNDNFTARIVPTGKYPVGSVLDE